MVLKRPFNTGIMAKLLSGINTRKYACTFERDAGDETDGACHCCKRWDNFFTDCVTKKTLPPMELKFIKDRNLDLHQNNR
jgi:hypothetical protein